MFLEVFDFPLRKDDPEEVTAWGIEDDYGVVKPDCQDDDSLMFLVVGCKDGEAIGEKVVAEDFTKEDVINPSPDTIDEINESLEYYMERRLIEEGQEFKEAYEDQWGYRRLMVARQIASTGFLTENATPEQRESGIRGSINLN